MMPLVEACEPIKDDLDSEISLSLKSSVTLLEEPFSTENSKFDQFYIEYEQ